MKKSLLMLLTLVFVASMALAGCGSKTADKPAPETPKTETPATEPAKEETKEAEPFTITLRHIQVGEPQKHRFAILQDVVKKTEADVPGLKIELDGIEDNTNRNTKLPAEMAAGNPPQIFDLFGGKKDAMKYAKAGRLLELTPIIEELGLKDQFLDMSQFTVDGKVYGLPIGASTEGFYYNKLLFEKYGLTPPKTWDELENILATLKKNNETPLGGFSKAAWAALMMPNTMWARYAGPEFIFGLNEGTSKFNSPEIVAALTKFDEWNKKGYFPKGQLGIDYPERIGQLTTGKAAIMFDGNWTSSALGDPKQAGDMVGKIGYFNMPPAPGGKGDQTFVNGNASNGYGFRSDLNENELKAVKAFIKNMYTPEMQERGLLEDNLLPSMKLSPDVVAKVTDPIIKDVMAGMTSSAGLFPVFDTYVSSEVNTAIEQNIQKLIDGKVTPQAMADAVQKVADASK